MKRSLEPTAILLLALSAALCMADEPQSPLAPQRWRERTFGVSIRPPLGAQIHELTADEALVRILGDPGYAIKLAIRASANDVNIAVVKRTATEQFGTLYPSAAIVIDEDIKPAGRPGALLAFQYTDKRQQAWLVAQAFMQIDPRNIVLVQMDVPAAHKDATLPLFRAVIESLQVDDPRTMDNRNRELVKAGQAWLDRLDPKTLRQNALSDQWFRIVRPGPEGQSDIGYMRLSQRDESVMGKPGIRIDVQARLKVGEQFYDSLSNFFLSDDRQQEVWSVKTTVRPAGAAKVSDAGPPNASWAETGLRDGPEITVSKQTPSRVKEEKWRQPTVGYLSQVELYILPSVMARSKEGSMAFYAYNPATGKITLRQENVRRTPEGLELVSQPAPDQGEQVSLYDSQGKLLQRRLPDASLLLPASLKEIAALWDVR